MDVLEMMQAELNTPKNQFNGEEPICEKCHNTGWVMYEDEQGYMWQKECECGYRQKSIMQSRLRFASIPEMYRDVKLTDLKLSIYQTDEAKETFTKAGKAVKYWLDNLDKMIEKGKGNISSIK